MSKEWCTECQSSLGHREHCSNFVLCTRERVIALEAALTQAREALLAAKKEIIASGNWTAMDYRWPEVRNLINAALVATQPTEPASTE